MKANKAHRRLGKIEDSISDLIERYSADAPEIRQQLLDAKAAVGRARDAVSSQASSEKTSAPKKAATKKAAVKVPRAKAAKKHGPTKQDLEG
jgi:Holliday junction resolvasome RuvABC endonuclease subunit